METTTAIQRHTNRESLHETPAPMALGAIVDGRYELRRVIGAGSEGVVYEAIHQRLTCRVAIKFPSMSGGTTMVESRKRRLAREGRILASLNHPGTVRAHDAGVTSGGMPYLAMELLDGKTLETLLTTRGRLPVRSAVLLAKQLAETVASAHERGFLHRDIKPANVMVVATADGERAKLLDFGVARARATERSDGRAPAERGITGTPAYMSKEQLLGAEDLDERTDVYAIGAVLHECLSGRVIHSGSYPAVVRAMMLPGPTPAIDLPLPEGLAAVIGRAVAKSREDRFGTAGELAAALAPFCADATLELLVAPAPEQRRRHVRVPYLGPVRLRSLEGVVDGRSEDLSRTGMLFFSRSRGVAGQSYIARFVAPLSGHIVSAVTIARWAKERLEGGWAIGLEFVDPPAHLTTDIDAFIQLMDHNRTVEPESSPLGLGATIEA